MFSSLKLGKICGIGIFIHWTFWLLPLWILLTSGVGENRIALGLHLLLVAAVFGCVVLHELGHALAARHFGIPTRSITLSPLGGMAQMERMFHKPWEEFCIAVAGPLVNVVLAGMFATGLFAMNVVRPTLIDSGLGNFLGLLVLMNIVMVVFNLLPAFPMDGGRVLRALLSHSMGLLPGTRVAVLVGTVVAVLMGLAGVLLFGNPWMVMIAIFVAWAGRQELRALEGNLRAREFHEDKDFAPLLGTPSFAPSTSVVVFVWDPRLGAWIRR